MFPTTHWSTLAAATLHGDSRATAALGSFYERYRGPVRSFYKYRGVEEAEADDLVQGFFLHAMQHSLLRRADRERGLFRSYLCGAAAFFLSHWRERQAAARRGGDMEFLALDAPGTPEPATEDDQRAFDRAWALRILELSFARVAATYAGNAERFAVLREFLPGSVRQPSTVEAARRAGINENTLRSEVHRLRAEFRECLRAEVALTTSSLQEVDSELAWLREVLSAA